MPAASPADLESLFSEGLAELPAIEPPSGAAAALAALALLVDEWGQRMNLTGHRDPRLIARRLLLDAAALLASLPPFESLADLGSGAGLPGLPMAVLRPSARVFLVEARERRHYFQRHAIRELGLDNARAIRGRLEEAEPVPCDLVVAQAVAAPEALVRGMLRWAGPGALLVVPGGELHRAAGAHPGLEDVQSGHYQVPLGGPRRTIWTARAL